MLETVQDLPQFVTWEWMARQPYERNGIHRVTKLRNYGIRTAQTHWIAFLDDDNEWREDHLATLLACASRDGTRAIHSHMALFWSNSAPYLEPQSPWRPIVEEARAEYWDFVRRGIFQPGTNIVRDRIDPLDHPDPVRTVDMGEWLLARELLLETPLQEDFTDREEVEIVGEDDKLILDLLNHEESISCTHQPTLYYYLGGQSNRLVVA